MCIEKTTAWKYGDEFFPTEGHAIEAALHSLAVNLLQQHSSNLALGLIANDEAIIRLLTRRREIEAAKASLRVAQAVAA